jgi:hypothetical protein
MGEHHPCYQGLFKQSDTKHLSVVQKSIDAKEAYKRGQQSPLLSIVSGRAGRKIMWGQLVSMVGTNS